MRIDLHKHRFQSSEFSWVRLQLVPEGFMKIWEDVTFSCTSQHVCQAPETPECERIHLYSPVCLYSSNHGVVVGNTCPSSVKIALFSSSDLCTACVCVKWRKWVLLQTSSWTCGSTNNTMIVYAACTYSSLLVQPPFTVSQTRFSLRLFQLPQSPSSCCGSCRIPPRRAFCLQCLYSLLCSGLACSLAAVCCGRTG